MNTKHTRITDSPDALKLDGKQHLFNAPEAAAFFFVGDTAVIGAQTTHQAMFATMRRLDPARAAGGAGYEAIQAELAQESPSRHLRENGVVFYPAAERSKTVQELLPILARTGVHGNRRRRLNAGRLWANIKSPRGLVSAISFWVKRAKVSPHLIDILVAGARLRGKILVEFIDSAETEYYVGHTPTKHTANTEKALPCGH